MKDLNSINHLKSSSRIIVVISAFLLIFGLLFDHIPIVTLACALMYWAYGLLDSIFRLHKKK